MVMDLNDGKPYKPFMPGKIETEAKTYDEAKTRGIREILKGAGLAMLGICKEAKNEIKDVRAQRKAEKAEQPGIMDKIKENERVQQIGEGLGKIGHGTVEVVGGLGGLAVDGVKAVGHKGGEILVGAKGVALTGCRTARNKYQAASKAVGQKRQELKERGKIKRDIRAIESEIRGLNNNIVKLQGQIEKHKKVQQKSDNVQQKIQENWNEIEKQEIKKEYKERMESMKPKTLFDRLLKWSNPDASIKNLTKKNGNLLSKLNNQDAFIREKEQKIAGIKKQINAKEKILAELQKELAK